MDTTLDIHIGWTVDISAVPGLTAINTDVSSAKHTAASRTSFGWRQDRRPMIVSRDSRQRAARPNLSPAGTAIPDDRGDVLGVPPDEAEER